ncbi:hypothetical protein RhiirC2_805026, partial [Rhizophagus irregularis]
MGSPESSKMAILPDWYNVLNYEPTNTLQQILPILYDDLPTPAINISQSQDLWIDHGSLRVLTPPSHPGQAPNENFVDVSMGAAFIESH